VQWSTGAQTALAEAEVEYQERIDPAIHVGFQVATGPPAEIKRLVRDLDDDAVDASCEPGDRRASNRALRRDEREYARWHEQDGCCGQRAAGGVS